MLLSSIGEKKEGGPRLKAGVTTASSYRASFL